MTVVINGTSGYIADFSNATVANRQAFQTSTTNSSTGIYALPNGTSTAASWQATNNSDPTNASKILIATNGSTDVQLVSGINGTGTYLPMSFYTNGSERVRVDTSGNVKLSTAGTKILNSSGNPILNQTGGVLQVVQTVKTDTFSTSSTSPVDITGLSVSITPASTSSKILVLVDIKGWAQNSMEGGVQLLRNGSAIYIGDTAGSRIRVSASGFYASGSPTNVMGTGVAIYLDSPASASSVTYKLQCYCNSNATYINRQAADGDGNDTPRSASSITVMEIAG